MPTARQIKDAKARGPDYPNDLKVKTRMCQRLAKEIAFYVAETKENEDKLEAMKQPGSGKDEFDVKNFENVLAESVMMIPDATTRYKAAVDDLAVFVSTAENEKGVKESEFWEQAVELVGKENGASNATTTEVDLADGEAF